MSRERSTKEVRILLDGDEWTATGEVVISKKNCANPTMRAVKFEGDTTTIKAMLASLGDEITKSIKRH